MSGCESFLQGSVELDFLRMDCQWDLSLGQGTGDGKFDGETFWVGCGFFSSSHPFLSSHHTVNVKLMLPKDLHKARIGGTGEGKTKLVGVSA